jgi:hypothetical protein
MRLALAAAFALLALPGPAAAQDHPLDGTWEGVYICNQGKTGLTLTLDATPEGRVTGTFAFWPRSDNPGAARGSFSMQGEVKPAGDLNLRWVRWIQQPSGYAMVNLEGRAYAGKPGEKDTLMGKVTGLAGCTDWVVQR